MNSESLEQLSELLDAAPPQEYLNLLEFYPPELLTARRAIDDSESEGFVADVELQLDLEEVVRLNQEVRADAIPDPDGNEVTWPKQCMVIGESGEGDYYCVDVDEEFCSVLRFNHHAVEFEVFADSLGEFIEILIDTYCDEDAATG